MKTKVLESEQSCPDGLIKRFSQVTYKIHPHHVDFFEKLQKLPVKHKIELMNISVLEAQEYVYNEKQRALIKVAKIFSIQWYWRETGDEVEIYKDTIPDVPFTLQEMKAKNRKLETLLKIIDFFEGENSEVYNKEEDYNND